MCSTQHCLSYALCTFWTPKTIPKPRNTAPFTSQRPSAKLDQHYPHPCFVLLVHCPRAACTDACGATMCSTQPCLPRAFCTFWTPKTIPQPRNTAPFTSPRASAKHGAALPPPYFVLLLHCPRAACTDACGATMCSTQPCLPRAFCTFWTPKTTPQPRNTAPFTSPHASAKHGAALPPPCFVLLLHCPRAACNDACDPRQLPSRSPPQPRSHPASRLAPLHLPSPTPSPPMRLQSSSPPSSLPSPVPIHAPPVSLPSIFPPQPRPHPCASRLAPLHLPSPAPSPSMRLLSRSP